jgi:hypothetical protein
MRAVFSHLAPRPDRRIVRVVNSLRPFGLSWAWTVLAALLCLYGFATIEPEAAEAVSTTIGIGGIGCVLWGIWQLMQYDQ